MPVIVTTFPFLELLDELLSASELTEDELIEDELLIIATLLDELDIAGALEAIGVLLGDPPPPPQADKVSINATPIKNFFIPKLLAINS